MEKRVWEDAGENNWLSLEPEADTPQSTEQPPSHTRPWTAAMKRRTEVAWAAECVVHCPSSSCCSYVGRAFSHFLFTGERWSHNDVPLDNHYFRKWLLLLHVGLTVLGFVAWFWAFKGKLMSSLQNLFQKRQEEEMLCHILYMTSITLIPKSRQKEYKKEIHQIRSPMHLESKCLKI